MIKRKQTKLLAALPLAALVFSACGSSSSKTSATTAAAGTTTAAATTVASAGAGTTTASASTAAGTTTGSASTAAGSTTAGSTTASTSGSSGGLVVKADELKAVCPATISIQTDWNPEGEHGFLYNLMGPNPTINADKKIVSGELIAHGGVDTGVKFEVRSGGPAIGYQTVTSQIYSDPNLTLGYVYTDEAIQLSDKFPTVAIENGFIKNPQMIMWDPATYPNVKTLADLGKANVKVHYFSGAAYMDYFTSAGIFNKANVAADYDGTPANFVAQQGKEAQQGFGSAEPYIYQNEIAQWKKPVAYAYINDAGWKNYAESIATKPENITKLADCFKLLVPIIQQSSIDYLNDPKAANTLILDLVAKYNNGWVYSQGVADYAVATIKKDGLVANSPDGTLGSFDTTRVDDLIKLATPIYTGLGSAPKSGLKSSDIVTNQFIDKTIHM